MVSALSRLVGRRASSETPRNTRVADVVRFGAARVDSSQPRTVELHFRGRLTSESITPGIRGQEGKYEIRACQCCEMIDINSARMCSRTRKPCDLVAGDNTLEVLQGARGYRRASRLPSAWRPNIANTIKRAPNSSRRGKSLRLRLWSSNYEIELQRQVTIHIDSRTDEEGPQ
ncbi:hypothetical protein BGW80DRAFT_1252630 [Lactifluus volemus]|nr:hypothetical protein BGW80DRAFT_1252630 [Lactifluus volemus]